VNSKLGTSHSRSTSLDDAPNTRSFLFGMLKRKRPVSPPPSLPDVFVDSDPSLPGLTFHKRQRTLPPVLDGQARGWNLPSQEGVDYESDSDGSIFTEGSGNLSGDEVQAAAWDYKSANSLLHHMHQRRLVSSSSYHLSEPSRYQERHTFPSAPKSATPNTLAMPHEDHAYTRDMVGAALPSHIGASSSIHMDELQRVKDRYEDSNKYVFFHPLCTCSLTLRRLLKTLGFVIPLAEARARGRR
jgi:hypothetical protein